MDWVNVVSGPWQNRDKTARVELTWVAFWAKSRFPKLLKTLKVEENLKNLWRRPRCAQDKARYRAALRPDSQTAPLILDRKSVV